ncbi:MAG: hypothetical protein GY757_11955, partial [bacterium]|nr:hypothetical protein [bacterium]
ETHNPGCHKKMKKKKYKEALSVLKKKEVPFLYWSAAGWLSAFSINPFDMKLGMTVPGARAMMERVMELNPDFEKGTLHDFYVLYYGSMPDYMGGDFNKAREHYKLAVAANPKKTSPHLSLATSVCVQEQKLEEFKTLLNKVLEIDPDADPENRLVNTINLRKAKWLLEHLGDFFLEAGDEDEDNDDEFSEEKNAELENQR